MTTSGIVPMSQIIPSREDCNSLILNTLPAAGRMGRFTGGFHTYARTRTRAGGISLFIIPLSHKRKREEKRIAYILSRLGRSGRMGQ